MTGAIVLNHNIVDDRKVIFSPFGLGVLDLAVAGLVQKTVD